MTFLLLAVFASFDNIVDPPFFFFKIVFLSIRKHKLGRMAEGKGEAYSLLSSELDMGLYPRTLGS